MAKRKKTAKIKKSNYNVNLNPRRPLYILRSPISVFPIHQLPTNGTVLRYYQYVITEKSKRFKSTQENFSCKTKSGSRDMVCHDKDFCYESMEICCLRKVVNIWKYAGFGKYIISEVQIVKKFIKLNKLYISMRNTSYLSWNTITKKNHENRFEEFLENLFDISQNNIEDKIKSDKDMPRSNDAVIEDLAFLQDQRTMRRGVISDKYDIDMQQRVERRIKRYERMRSYEEKCRVNVELKFINLELVTKQDLWRMLCIFFH